MSSGHVQNAAEVSASTSQGAFETAMREQRAGRLAAELVARSRAGSGMVLRSGRLVYPVISPYPRRKYSNIPAYPARIYSNYPRPM